MDRIVQRFLEANRDMRRVVTDPESKYLGTVIDDRSLTPGPNPRIGPTRFENWLSRSGG